MNVYINTDKFTYIEFKTLHALVDLTDNSLDAEACKDATTSTKTVAIWYWLKELSKDLSALDRKVKKVVKTKTAAHYVKLVVMRPLLHMRVLLRQKLALSAPVVRLVLRNRAWRILATHPPIAPPQFA